MQVTKQHPQGQLKGLPFHYLVVETEELVWNMNASSSQKAACL